MQILFPQVFHCLLFFFFFYLFLMFLVLIKCFCLDVFVISVTEMCSCLNSMLKAPPLYLSRCCLFYRLLHCCFTVPMFETMVLLADELVRFFIDLNHRAADPSIQVLQFLSWQMFHNAGSERVSQHIGGGSEAIPVTQVIDI